MPLSSTQQTLCNIWWHNKKMGNAIQEPNQIICTHTFAYIPSFVDKKKRSDVDSADIFHHYRWPSTLHGQVKGMWKALIFGNTCLAAIRMKEALQRWNSFCKKSQDGGITTELFPWRIFPWLVPRQGGRNSLRWRENINTGTLLWLLTILPTGTLLIIWIISERSTEWIFRLFKK